MNKNLTAFVLIILAVGIYFTVTEKILAGGKEIQKVNDQYIDALDTAKELIDIREKILQDYNNLSDEDRIRLEKMIPSGVDNIKLIMELDNIAVRNGFQLQDIEAAASDDAKKNQQPAMATDAAGMPLTPADSIPVLAQPVLDTVKVSFEAKAPYLRFISFLKEVEANLRLMDVTSLKVKATDDGLYEYTVELQTYWLRQQQ